MGWFSAEPSTDETASVDVGSVASVSVTSSAEFKKSQLESALRMVKAADDEAADVQRPTIERSTRRIS